MGLNTHSNANIGERYQDQVSWFIKDLGYGVIKFIDKKIVPPTIFCHVNHVFPCVVPYKDLYPGEYVEFVVGYNLSVGFTM